MHIVQLLFMTVLNSIEVLISFILKKYDTLTSTVYFTTVPKERKSPFEHPIYYYLF